MTINLSASISRMREFVQIYDVRKYEKVRQIAPAVVSTGEGAVYLYLVTIRFPDGFKAPHTVGYMLLDKLLMKFQKHKRFEYMMLDRLRSDCDYYLGYGERHANGLWAHDERQHIKEMRRLYNLLPFKPQWCTVEKIGQYAKEMNLYEQA